MENRGYITITGLENKDEQPIVSVKIENGNVWMTKIGRASCRERVCQYV